MLEYVYIKNKRKSLKVPCSELEENLPDFSKTFFTAEDYENEMKEAEKWEEYLYRDTAYKDAYKNLFIQNFKLFCTHHQEIISRPEFANIRWVYPFWWCRYGAIHGTLSEALTLWLIHPSYDGSATLSLSAVLKMREAYKTDKSIKPVHIVELLTYLGKFKEAESKGLFYYFANPPVKPKVFYADIHIPLKAWTENFAMAALKAGLPFGYLPARFKTQELLDKALALNKAFSD